MRSAIPLPCRVRCCAGSVRTRTVPEHTGTIQRGRIYEVAGAVLADDAETLYSEADKAARSLEKEWGIPCRLVRTEVADIE